MTCQVVLVKCKDYLVPDIESVSVIEALERSGIEARLEAWEDEAVDWSAAPLTIIRSTWNYTEDLQAFLAFVERASAQTSLHNPPAVMRWNTHKRYLLELEAAGVAIVPTRLVEPGGDPGSLDGSLVIKPAVSVGALGTAHIEDDPEAAHAHLDLVLRDGVALIQPFCAAIREHGERSLVYFDGRLSHVIQKRPQPGDFRVHEHFGGTNAAVEPRAADVAIAEGALAYVARRFGPAPLLYARIDVVDAPDGPGLGEMELIEPYLYLRDATAPEAARGRLLDAIRRRLR